MKGCLSTVVDLAAGIARTVFSEWRLARVPQLAHLARRTPWRLALDDRLVFGGQLVQSVFDMTSTSGTIRMLGQRSSTSPPRSGSDGLVARPVVLGAVDHAGLRSPSRLRRRASASALAPSASTMCDEHIGLDDAQLHALRGRPSELIGLLGVVERAGAGIVEGQRRPGRAARSRFRIWSPIGPVHGLCMCVDRAGR